MTGALISLFVTVLILALIYWAVTSILALLPLPPPFAQIVNIILIVLICIVLINALMGLRAGHQASCLGGGDDCGQIGLILTMGTNHRLIGTVPLPLDGQRMLLDLRHLEAQALSCSRHSPRHRNLPDIPAVSWCVSHANP